MSNENSGFDPADYEEDFEDTPLDELDFDNDNVYEDEEE